MSRYTKDELFSILEYSAKALGVSDEEIYEFARCVRPDGSVYGTKGKCRKGSEQAKTSEKPESKARSPQSERKVLKEMAKAGGRFHLPAKSKMDTPEEVQGRVGRLKKSAEEGKKREEKKAEHDKKVGKMAEGIYTKGGGKVEDTLYSRNRVNNVKEALNDVSRAGREGAKHVENGDTEALLKHAKKVVEEGVKTHVERVVKAKREEQKTKLKEMVAKKKASGASAEDIAQAKANENFYFKRELKRTAHEAETEWNALYTIDRTTRGKT